MNDGGRCFAIDARLNAYRAGGIASYTRQLVAAMAPLLGPDRLLVLQHRRQREPLVVAAGVSHRHLFTPPHNRFEQLALPIELLAQRVDMAHFPDFVAPRLRSYPAVVTIHDLAFLRYPEILDDEARRYYGQVQASARGAQAVIADSQATRDDIVDLLGLDPAGVTVITLAAGPAFRRLGLAPGAERVVNGQALRAGAFGLFVSTIEPRKNLPTLLRALRVCRERRPGAGYRLVLAGARGWRDQPILDLIGELGLGDAVAFLGPVSEDELVWLYNACRIYLNPSRYEGFGLPLLEALACGAPAIASATSSLPEVAGSAARLVPPEDIAAWAEALGGLWEDEGARADLARRGPPRAAEFSWERTAAATLALYRQISRGAGPGAA